MTVTHRFGRGELRPETRQLFIEGKLAPLGARAFDVLTALVERRDRLVTKAELLDVVWPDLVVEENNLQVQISTLRKVLGSNAIATIPGRGYRLTLPVENDDTGAAVPPADPAARTDVAAYRPPLIGRDEDLAALTRLHRAHPLVTLVGPGGVGKTVLARALMAGLTADGGRTSAWVDLASVTDPTQLAAATATAIGLRLGGGDSLQALAFALQPLALTVMLDNAEHLIDGVADMTVKLMQSAPGARFVVTSQAPLGIAGEHVFRVDPLAVPAGAPGRAEALGFGAIALFVELATAADRRFVLTESNVRTITEICRRLDGIPLAIEMAAARARFLGVTKLLDALDVRFSVLTTGHRTAAPRQATLHAALDWSHDLLNGDERMLFRRLGVFSNGFTVELARSVAGGDDDEWRTIDLLASLVSRSLVAASSDDPPRYHLPETMRAFALERLNESGEENSIRARHARAICEFYEAAVDAAGAGVTTNASAATNERELDNARVAFQWALTHDPTLAIALSSLAARFTVWGARRAEALQWLSACEPLLDDAMPLALQARWWREIARFRLFQRRDDASMAARRALALERVLGNPAGIAQSLAALIRSQRETTEEVTAALAEMRALLAAHPEWPVAMRYLYVGTEAHVATHEDDLETAKRYRIEEARLAGEMGSRFAQNAVETNVIAIIRAQGHYDEVIERARSLLARLRTSGELGNMAYAGLHMLFALLSTGRLEEARECAAETWASCRQLNLPLIGDALAHLCAKEQRLRAAAQLLGYARRRYAQEKCPRDDTVGSTYAEAMALIESGLDPVEIEDLQSEGARFDDDDAIRVALEVVDAT